MNKEKSHITTPTPSPASTLRETIKPTQSEIELIKNMAKGGNSDEKIGEIMARPVDQIKKMLSDETDSLIRIRDRMKGNLVSMDKLDDNLKTLLTDQEKTKKDDEILTRRVMTHDELIEKLLDRVSILEQKMGFLVCLFNKTNPTMAGKVERSLVSLEGPNMGTPHIQASNVSSSSNQK